MKKGILLILGAAVALLLTGCSSAPVVLAPVGPNPVGFQTTTANGQLEVFSAVSGRGEGNDPTWYQHSDYYICNGQGKQMEHINNAQGHYSESPRIMSLAAGKYIIKARAKGTLWTKVPVIVKSGEITRVHLDGNWQPSPDTPKTEVVSAPQGYPIGWRDNTTK